MRSWLSKVVTACVVAAGVSAFGVASPVLAEDPDVGETVATAGTAYGQTTITGTLTAGDGVDLYAICISDPATFSVTIGGLSGGGNDGQLFLFDATGLGKAWNDDTTGFVPAFPAGAAVLTALTPGEYLLAVSNINRDPVTAGNQLIFADDIDSGVDPVVGPAIADQPLASWINTPGATGVISTYTMTLTGVGCGSPNLSSPADITVAATSGSGATVVYTAPTATNFLDQPLAVVCAPASGSLFPIGTTTVTCTTTDALNQSASDTFLVNVVNTPPSVTVPADITVNATGPSGADVLFVATAFDLEQGAFTPVCAPPSGSTFPIGTTIVTCTATDFAGLQASDTFNVTVEPNAPIVTVPANITVKATSASGAAVTFTASATDVEDGPLTPVCTPSSGSTFAIGTTTVTCTVTDSDDESASDTFTVTVQNNAPVLTVPANMTVNATSASGATVTFTTSATDIEDATVPIVCVPASGSTFAIGTTTVNCTATDSARATDTESFAVTVVNTPPVISPPNLSAPATSASGAVVTYTVTATDAQQGAVAVTCSPPSGSIFPIGVTTVTCTATDSSGATTTSSFAVTVTNAQLPATGGSTRTPVLLAGALVALGVALRAVRRIGHAR